MDDSTVKPETAVEANEAILDEIRAQLRARSAEEVVRPRERPIAIKSQDTAALRLLSGCA